MEPLYTRYIQETFGPDGQVTDWHYHYEDNFNYAYDIIDTVAAAEPWRLAMLWRNDRGADLAAYPAQRHGTDSRHSHA